MKEKGKVGTLRERCYYPSSVPCGERKKVTRVDKISFMRFNFFL